MVFPCGSEIGLEIHRALRGSKYFRVFGASSVDDHGKYVYKHYISSVPFVDSEDFVPAIKDIVERFRIDFIVPAHDSATLALAEHDEHIDAEIVTSALATCRLCRSKKQTYDVLRNQVPVPKLYHSLGDVRSYPVFLKPDIGQGSKGTSVALSEQDITYHVRRDGSLLIMEYLPGKEYTVDCFTDKHGSLLFCAGRVRSRISNGISVHASPVVDERFQQLATILNAKLSFRGVWFFQLKERDEGELVLMEVSPRIAGTMAMYRACGVNFIELSLFDRIVENVQVLYQSLALEIDRALISILELNLDYDYVYLDFDDKLVVNGAVNVNIIQFLYQCSNLNKQVILISRHRYDIHKTLATYSICAQLFTRIIVIGDDDEKYKYISEPNSIFIDDSFSERKKVNDRCGIPVFALDAVEALIVDRS